MALTWLIVGLAVFLGAHSVRIFAIGLIAWWVFAQYLHGWLIGVRPFG